MDTGVSVTIPTSRTTVLKEFKKLVEEKFNIKPENQRLFFAGKQVRTTHCLNVLLLVQISDVFRFRNSIILSCWAHVINMVFYGIGMRILIICINVQRHFFMFLFYAYWPFYLNYQYVGISNIVYLDTLVALIQSIALHFCEYLEIYINSFDVGSVYITKSSISVN